MSLIIPTGFITNIHKDHKCDGHYERPERVTDSIEYILKRSNTMKLEVNKDYNEKSLMKLYTPRYVDKIFRLSNSETTGNINGNPDCYYTKGTYTASTTAVYSNLTLLDNILNGKVRNGFALTRPPGHHSSCDHSSGFCVFNTISVLAQECVDRGLRPMILDFDIHHGDGTQKFFEDRDDVLFISIHRYGQRFYPGTGNSNEIGKGKGKGYTVNVPFLKGKNDSDYLVTFDKIIIPIMNQFKPDIILVSAGFDAHYKDPLAATEGMKLTSFCYGAMISRVMKYNDKILATLEGGYSVDAIKESVSSIVEALNGRNNFVINTKIPSRKTYDTLNSVKRNLKKYWELDKI